MYTSVEDLQERMNKNQGPDREKFGLIKDKKEEAFKIAKTMPHLIQFFSEKIRDDDDVAKAIIQCEPTCIGYLSERVKNDKNFVEMAIEKDGWAYTAIGEEAQKNKVFLFQAIEKAVDVLAVIHDNPIIKKQDVILSLLEINKESIKYIDINSIENKTMQKALAHNGLLLEYVSEEVKNDKEMVLLALKNNEEALEFSSPMIKEICKEGEPIKILEKTIKREKIDKMSNGIDNVLKKAPRRGGYIYIWK